MEKNIKIITLIIMLIIVCFTFGFIYSLDNTNIEENIVNVEDEARNNNELLVLNGDVEVPSKTTIVSDKFAGDLKEGYKTVVVGNDGSLIEVHDGVVLTRGVVISSEAGETNSVYKIESPEKSVYMN